MKLAYVIRNRISALLKEEVHEHIIYAENNDQNKNKIYFGQDVVHYWLFIALCAFISHDVLQYWAVTLATG